MIYLDEFGALSGATANISFVFDKVWIFRAYTELPISMHGFIMVYKHVAPGLVLFAYSYFNHAPQTQCKLGRWELTGFIVNTGSCYPKKDAEGSIAVSTPCAAPHGRSQCPSATTGSSPVRQSCLHRMTSRNGTAWSHHIYSYLAYLSPNLGGNPLIFNDK